MSVKPHETKPELTRLYDDGSGSITTQADQNEQRSKAAAYGFGVVPEGDKNNTSENQCPSTAHIAQHIPCNRVNTKR